MKTLFEMNFDIIGVKEYACDNHVRLDDMFYLYCADCDNPLKEFKNVILKEFMKFTKTSNQFIKIILLLCCSV